VLHALPRHVKRLVVREAAAGALQQKKLLNKTCRAEGARGGLTHHQSFDVARQGVKHATTEKLRPKDRPLVNDFV
jgi:hypothetical protein